MWWRQASIDIDHGRACRHGRDVVCCVSPRAALAEEGENDKKKDSPWIEGPSFEDASANTLAKCAAKCKAAKTPAMQFNPPEEAGGGAWCGCLSFVDGHSHAEFDKAMDHKSTDRDAHCVICELELPPGARAAGELGRCCRRARRSLLMSSA